MRKFLVLPYLAGLVLALVLAAGCHHREAATNPTQVTPASSTTLSPKPEAKKEVTEPFPASSVNSQPMASSITGATLGAVYFDFNKADLSADDRRRLQQNADWLKSHPTDRILIAGNCDERGSISYNIALGDRRAEAAREYLRALGVDPSRIQTVSYGKERPVDPGHNETSWAKNRRDDFSKTDASPGLR